NSGLLWQGAIDEVRIFTRRALTPQEVSNMYNQPLAITSNALIAGSANTPYSRTLRGSGGNQPYFWSVTSGALPQGISLSPSGILSGIPAGTGTFSFTVRLD